MGFCVCSGAEPGDCLPEVWSLIALAAAVALAPVFGIQLETYIQPAVVTGAAIVAASLWPHILLLMQFFYVELRRRGVFDIKYGFLCWHIYCPLSWCFPTHAIESELI